MTIKYSAAARGFFDTALHRAIPDDAVNVTAKRYADLLVGQAEGQEIVPSDQGRPVLRSLAPTTTAAARAVKLKSIKSEAARRINERMPLWRQINALRESSDPGFHEIDAIRQASNLIEQQLADITLIEVIAKFPVSTHPLWPAFDRSEIDS